MNPSVPVNKPFANSHPSDRNFFLIMLLIVWAAILSGFIYDMVDLNKKGLLHFPWITHVHAALFVAASVYPADPAHQKPQPRITYEAGPVGCSSCGRYGDSRFYRSHYV